MSEMLNLPAQDRGTARRNALLALHGWMLGCLADATALADSAGHAGRPDVLIVMRGISNEWDLDPEDAEDELKEALVSVDVVSASGVTTLNRDTYAESWADVVKLWDDLREVVAYQTMLLAPASLVLDLDKKTVATVEPIHCPDVGPLEAWASAERPPLGTGDPFEEILTSLSEDEEEDLGERIVALADRYGIALPTEPHEGDCESTDD